jgi:diguanylate cyclase (GGDEF)-like protein
MSPPPRVLRSAQIAVCVVLSFALFFGIQLVLGLIVPALPHPWPSILGIGLVTVIDALTLPPLVRGQHTLVGLDNHTNPFRTAAENSLDDIYLFSGIPDASGNIVDFRFAYINPVAERRLRARRETLLGRSLSEVRPYAVSSGLIQRYQEVVRTGIPYTGELFIDDERITATWLHVHAVKLGDGIAITSRDVTERRRATDHASFLAHHDQLTGLPNRALLRSHLDAAIRQAESENTKVAVFMIDVDNFKQINDSFGHLTGDTILTATAKRLLNSVRPTDIVARIGGDEFVIVVPKFKDLADIDRCGEKILRAVDKPIVVDGDKINVTISAGSSIYPDSGIEAADLLRKADAAMYNVKSTGRNGLRIFNETISSPQDRTFA